MCLLIYFQDEIMLLKYLSCSILSCLCASSIYADTVKIKSSVPSMRSIVSLAVGGVSTSNLGVAQHFPIINPVTDQNYTYSGDNQSKTNPMIEVYMGYEFDLTPEWMLQAGVAYAQTSTFQVNGTLTQGVDAVSSDQYDYHYNVELKELLAQTKLIYARYESLYPYVLLGLGTTLNKASNFQTTVPATTATTKNYSKNTAHSLTYQLGFGIDIAV